jgi:DNA polymerase-3 subunit epsilon
MSTATSGPSRALQLDRPLVFFDLETTGTTIGVDRIVELAVIKLWPDGNTDSRRWLVNPEMLIPAEATKIHGISDADVRNAPTIKNLLPELRAVFRDSDVAGFNIMRFDLPLLHAEITRAGARFDISGRRVIDAMLLFHMMEPRNLAAAVKFYCGRELVDAHSAEADVEATVEVLKAQVRRYAEIPQTVVELEGFIGKNEADFVDRFGRWFIRNDGVICFAKGKHKGKRISEVPADYLEWMWSTNLPADTADVVQTELRQVKQARMEGTRNG